MAGDIIWTSGGRGRGGIRAALARAAAFFIAQSASRGVHLGWLERRLTDVWIAGDGTPAEQISFGHTDQHSDRTFADRHTDQPGKHVDVPAEPGHYDQVRPHSDHHHDSPGGSTHTDKFSDGFGDVAKEPSTKRPKLPSKKKSRRGKA